MAAESKTYCDELLGIVRAEGVEITELSTHLQGQLVAVHPAYSDNFDGFAPADKQGKPKERQAWAVQQLKYAALANTTFVAGDTSPAVNKSGIFPLVTLLTKLLMVARDLSTSFAKSRTSSSS